MSENRPEIIKYVGTVKTLQAVIHLHRFFKKREDLVRKLFGEDSLPPTFESMSEHFLLMADDRYPSADKVLQIIDKMQLPGFKEKIVVLSTMRDAVREMSPTRLYRSIQQRDELFSAIIEALSNLEDELEEEEDSE